MENSSLHFRERAPYYIPSSETDRTEMLQYCGYRSMEEIYTFLGNNQLNNLDIGKALEYSALASHLETISKKNNIRLSFLGNGLPDLAVSPMASYLCGADGGLRKLCTAYTPYQPELGQGTLIGLQIYSSMLQLLTGMEAINASLYDRASAMFEATQTAIRIHKGKKNTALVLGGVYPNDLWTLKTNAAHTQTKIEALELSVETGKSSVECVRAWLEKNHESCACVVIPQVSHQGIVEDFDALTDLCYEFSCTPIAVIDPFHLFPSEQSLKKPRYWGSKGNGVPIMVAEGQHLAIGPNFGGPGLGIFAVQYNDNDRQTIRSMPGRLVGQTKDNQGRVCFTLIMSTREQHIRREKATSNICSNQSFLALLAGACLLEKGYNGLVMALDKSHYWAKTFLNAINNQQSQNYCAVFPHSSIVHEVLIRTNKMDAVQLIELARQNNIHLGSLKGKNEILVSFSEKHNLNDIQKLFLFLGLPTQNLHEYKYKAATNNSIQWPQYTFEALKEYYKKLNDLNLSPDDGIYPLGSCTMKYNPIINEYAANLPGFTQLHPDTPIVDAQGTMQILFEIQELFKSITGLPYVTGLPVAGAQGELVGLKMFQQYFASKNELAKRKYLLIPRSAHGTNPATAAVANMASNLIIIEANAQGRMDLAQVQKVVQEYKDEIFGIMITNPNTSGIFEIDFKKVAELIHSVGGLVYMDGANMNAIAGQADLKSLGVDAVHNNLHKTWSIPHGGGGPGDAIVGVSEILKDFLPAHQVVKNTKTQLYEFSTPKYSMGTMHRHFGNVAHKIRCYTYIKALGTEGVKTMSAMATLSAQYLFKKIENKLKIPTLPANTENIPRMHEFILTLRPELFEHIINSGINKTQVIPQIGKLFLDYGFHAPTVAFPEPYGLMIEPTESYTKAELDEFANLIEQIFTTIEKNPEILKTAPHNTPVGKIDELYANKQIEFAYDLKQLPTIYPYSNLKRKNQ